MPPSLLDRALEHRVAVAATAVFLALLVLLRSILPAAERTRLRFPFAMLVVYLASVPVRAVLSLYFATQQPLHDGIALAANVALGLGVIAISSLFVFGVLMGARSHLRLLRDIAQA